MHSSSNFVQRAVLGGVSLSVAFTVPGICCQMCECILSLTSLPPVRVCPHMVQSAACVKPRSVSAGYKPPRAWTNWWRFSPPCCLRSARQAPQSGSRCSGVPICRSRWQGFVKTFWSQQGSHAREYEDHVRIHILRPACGHCTQHLQVPDDGFLLSFAWITEFSRRKDFADW